MLYLKTKVLWDFSIQLRDQLVVKLKCYFHETKFQRKEKAFAEIHKCIMFKKMNRPQEN